MISDVQHQGFPLAPILCYSQQPQQAWSRVGCFSMIGRWKGFLDSSGG